MTRFVSLTLTRFEPYMLHRRLISRLVEIRHVLRQHRAFRNTPPEPSLTPCVQAANFSKPLQINNLEMVAATELTATMALAAVASIAHSTCVRNCLPHALHRTQHDRREKYYDSVEARAAEWSKIGCVRIHGSARLEKQHFEPDWLHGEKIG